MIDDMIVLKVPLDALDGIQRVIQIQDIKKRKLPVGSHGFARLNDCMGDDRSISQQARVSYISNASSNADAEKDYKLLRFLMSQEHFSPFASVQIKMHYKMPLAIVAQWCRIRGHHRSEMSARYSVMPDECIIVDNWRIPSKHNKQVSEGSVDEDMQLELARLQIQAYEHSRSIYNKMLEMGAPKEQARFVLPVGQYTEFVMTINLGDMMRLLLQRLHPHAQAEIREYAEATLNILKDIYPVAFDAFRDYQLEAKKFSRQEWSLLCSLFEIGRDPPRCLANMTKKERQQSFSDHQIVSKSDRVAFMKKLDIYHLI
jgi:thymidylate synthase (FAD)